MKKFLLLGVAAAVAAAAPLFAASSQTIEGKPKIAFIYFNVKNDGGWVQAQEEARQYINSTTNYETAFTEKVEEVSSKIRPVVELPLAQQMHALGPRAPERRSLEHQAAQRYGC